MLSKAVSCAMRTRTYAGKPQRLEIGNSISNSITTVTKDFLVMEIYDEPIGCILFESEKFGGIKQIRGGVHLR